MPAPQHLRHAPCLRYATSRRMWSLRIEDLTDRSDASLVQVRYESLQERPRLRLLPRMQPQPGVDIRADQPRPYRPLVISCIARSQIAEIFRVVVGMIRR